MFVLAASTPMKRPLLQFLVVAVMISPSPVVAQKTVTALTDDEYRGVVERVLPCPPLERGDDSSRFCLRIVPPGHRWNERELLVTLLDRGHDTVLELRQPEASLAQAGVKAKAADPVRWTATMSVDVRSWRTSDSRIINQILGRSWRKITSAIFPSNEWLTDPTTYYLRAESMAGVIESRISGPGAEATRQSSGFLTWAERVRGKAERTLKERGTLQGHNVDH